MSGFHLFTFEEAWGGEARLAACVEEALRRRAARAALFEQSAIAQLVAAVASVLRSGEGSSRLDREVDDVPLREFGASLMIGAYQVRAELQFERAQFHSPRYEVMTQDTRLGLPCAAAKALEGAGATLTECPRLPLSQCTSAHCACSVTVYP